MCHDGFFYLIQTFSVYKNISFSISLQGQRIRVYVCLSWIREVARNQILGGSYSLSEIHFTVPPNNSSLVLILGPWPQRMLCTVKRTQSRTTGTNLPPYRWIRKVGSFWHIGDVFLFDWLISLEVAWVVLNLAAAWSSCPSWSCHDKREHQRQ